MNDITKIFIERPYLYPYFNENKPLIKNDPLLKNGLLVAQVISVSDLILDYIDRFDDKYVSKLEGIEENGKVRQYWNNYFVDQFKMSPALCDRYKEVKPWCDEKSGLNKLAALGCKDLN